MRAEHPDMEASLTTPIAYAQPAPGVSRRSFRLMMLLTLINTLMLGANLVGPGLNGFARQQWAEFQRRQAERKVQAQQAIVRQAYLPAQQQCMNYLAPPGTLLYAEDPEGIRRLTAAGPVNQVCQIDTINRPKEMISIPIGAPAPPFTANMPTTVTVPDTLFHSGPLFNQPRTTLLFLHQCRTPAGLRLVAVYVSCLQDCSELVHSSINKYGSDEGLFCNYALRTNRELVGVAMKPATSDADLAVLSDCSLFLNAGATLVTDSGKQNGKVTVDYAGQLRLFAGQPDPTDPARFHIPYQFDGTAGSIDGRLTVDDQIQLAPDRYLADKEVHRRDDVPSPDERRATGQPR